MTSSHRSDESGTRPPDRAAAADATPPAIQISGNVISGPFAVGSHAQANQWNLPSAELAQRLQRAIQDLRTGAATSLPADQLEQVNADTAELTQEITSPRPNRDRISQLLGRLTARVGSVAALLEVVDRVKDLIAALLH